MSYQSADQVETVPGNAPIISRRDAAALRAYRAVEFGEFGPTIRVRSSLVYAFAEITGDMNPLHLDPEAAARGPFQARVAHGALIVSMLPRLRPRQRFIIGDAAPVNLGGTQRFHAPVYFNQSVRACERLTSVRVTDHITVLAWAFQIWNATANQIAAECDLTLAYK